MTSPVPDAAPVRRTPVVAWLVLVLIVSVAGAGLIMSLDHPPTDVGRPELTARGHALVTPRLAAMDTHLQRLADAADRVAAAGRDTLTSLRGLDTGATDAALTAGATAISDVIAAQSVLQDARATLLDGTAMERLPANDQARIRSIDAALAAAGQLPGEWTQVAIAAGGPADLLRAMAAHDASVVAATEAGRDGQWASALDRLATAQQRLAPAKAVRNEATKAKLDTSTLSDLLDRLDTYDAALTSLYTSMRTSNGQPTDESRALLQEVGAAQASLPDDQTAMVVIISDLAGPTITPLLLSIETARGALEAALDTQPSLPPPSGASVDPAASGGVSS